MKKPLSSKTDVKWSSSENNFLGLLGFQNVQIHSNSKIQLQISVRKRTYHKKFRYNNFDNDSFHFSAIIEY